jgi:uroporphyrinogen decarboxylase
MNSRERVQRAIKFGAPDCIPIRYYDDLPASDIIIAAYRPAASWAPPEPRVDEWDCLWDTLDVTIGQVKRHPLTDPKRCANYHFPDPLAPGRLDEVIAARAAYPDRYVAGSLGISGFNRMTFLRGFPELLEDMILAPERVAWLADRVFGFELDIIRRFAPLQLDAVWFWDDWGTQRGLMISPQAWRKEFKPRYARQFALAHDLGMHVVFHSCGNVSAILGDLAEIGADMLHLNQPDLLGIDWLAKEVGGRVCLHCPVDTQGTLVHGTADDICRQAYSLIDRLSCFGGGFVACGDEGWGHGSVGADRLAIMRRAFETYGARPAERSANHE